MTKPGSPCYAGTPGYAVVALWLLMVVASVASLPAGTVRPQPAEAAVAGRAETVEAVAVLADGSAIRAADLAAREGTAKIRHVWVWGRDFPAQRVSPEIYQRATAGATESLAGKRYDLRSRLLMPAELRTTSGLRVLAAPVEMWLEVPEALLPWWPVGRDGVAHIPVTGTASRLRALGQKHGSWWVEAPAGRRTVEISLHRASSRRLRVLTEAGEPAHGVEAAAVPQRANRTGEAALARFDSSEQAVLEMLSLPDKESLFLVVEAVGTGPKVLFGRPSELPESVRLPAGIRARGRWLDERGAPLSGVEVTVEGWVSGSLPYLRSRETVSDEDGRWAVDGLPSGELAVLAELVGYAPFRTQLRGAEGVLDLGTVALREATHLLLVLADETGTPVADARVDALGLEPAVTDEMGECRLSGIDPEARLDLKVEKEGFLAASFALTPPHPQRRELVLKRGFTVVGRLVSDAGESLTDATVEAEQASVTTRLPTGADGSFQLTLRPREAALLRFLSPRTAPLEVSVLPAEAGGKLDLGDLAVPPGIAVTGQVLHATDGSPVVGARVWALRSSPKGPAVAWMMNQTVRGESDAQGEFLLSGLNPGPSILNVEAPGLARAMVPVTGEAREPLLQLEPILLGKGASLAVTLTEEGLGEEILEVDLGGRSLPSDLVTAWFTESQARLDHLPLGVARFRVMRGSDLLCNGEILLREQDEVVRRDCRTDRLRVHGRVLLGETPAAGGSLHWLTGSPEAPDGILRFQAPSGLRQSHSFSASRSRQQAWVSVAADGFFETENLRPGSWRVAWQPDSGETGEYVDVVIPSQAPEHELDLRFNGQALRGIVTTAQGDPVDEALVRDLTGRLTARTDTAGHFSFPLISPGVWRLQAMRGEESSEVVEVLVEADADPEPPTLVLNEATRDLLEITVLDTAEQPAAGSLVFLDLPQRGLRILTTDATGKADTRVPPPLPDRVRAAAFIGGHWVLGDWVSWERALEEFVLQTEATGSLVLHTEELSGGVEIESTGGWSVASLLSHMGSHPVLNPGLPLAIQGLPVGGYRVLWGGEERFVEIRRDRQSDLVLD